MSVPICFMAGNRHCDIFLSPIGLQQQQGIGVTRSASGVTKEDGEVFEEPPDVAAASAAASASVSGAETLEVEGVLFLKLLYTTLKV